MNQPTSDHESALRSPTDQERLLLEFVRERDVECPRCGYNLRNLTRPTCPECQEALSLKVGVERALIGWLLLTLAPLFFAGISGGFGLVMSAIHGWPPIEGIVTIWFCVLSGLVGIGLSVKSRVFLRQQPATQCVEAVTVWMIHIIAFLIFVSSV